MKSNHQDQANALAMWDVLKCKFEKSSTSKTSCREDDFHSHSHDDHQEDDAPPGERKRRITKRRVLIGEMEALGDRGVVVDCLECLKQTNARETDKLVALTEVLVETQAGIHEKEGHVARMDLND
nr:glycoside hydrolase, family 79 [Tanacetum cinerariifolium]